MALVVALCVSNVFAQEARTKVEQKPTTEFSLSAQSCAVSNSNRNTIYFEDFESTSNDVIPATWTVSHTGTAKSWMTVGSEGIYTNSQGQPNSNIPGMMGGITPTYAGLRMLCLPWQQTGRNAWTFSEGINLTAGTTYQISFWLEMPGYFQGGLNEYSGLECKIGQTNNAAGMADAFEIYYNNKTIVVDDWTLITKSFTPTATGAYYLGFHCLSASGTGTYTIIDDIKIEEGGTPPPDCDPATNLQVAYTNDCKAELTWDEPAKGKGNQWLTYMVGDFNGGVGLGQPADLSFAQRWSPSDLAALGIVAGNKVTKMKFFFSSGPYNPSGGGPQTYIEAATYEFKIWQGTSSTTAGTLLYTSPPLASATLDDREWNEITLATPIEIDPSLELWLGVRANMTAGAGPPCPYGTGGFVAGVNKMLYQGAWANIEGLIAGFTSGNWAIQGFVEGDGPVLSYYNVYRDDTKLTSSPITEKTYTDAGFNTAIEHTWAVTVVCGTDESDPITKTLLACKIPCDPATNLTVTFAENCTSADLAWTQPAPGQLYNIYRDGAMVKEKHDATTYTDTDLNAGEEYTWSVTVVCEAIESDPVTKTDKCEGINDLGLSTFTIAPNPALNEVVIKAGVVFNTIEVVNFLGQTVISKVVNNSSVKLDVSNLNNGVYFVRLVSENGTSVKKFVKQ